MARLFEYDESTAKERVKRLGGKPRMSRPPTPVTPIPRRASASSPGAVRVRSRYTSFSTELQDDDVTRLPTVPPSAIWHHEAVAYESKRRLAPVAVPAYSPLLPSSPSIDELATNPPRVPFQLNVSALRDEPSYLDAVIEADTVMDDTLLVVSSDIDMYPTLVEDVVDDALTLRARELLRRKGSLEDKPTFIRNPLDYIRWWLLCPGRLEFLFWLGGAVLLSIVLCVLLVMTGLGLGWIIFGHPGH